MLRRVLKSWAYFVHEHPVPLLVVLTALTLYSATAFKHLELQVDIPALLPDNSRAIQANYEMKASFGADLLILVLRDETGPVLRHADLVEILTGHLEDSELIESVDARLYENVPTELLLERLPLLLKPDELDALAKKVDGAEIHRQVRLDKHVVQGPMVPPLQKKFVVQDPLALVELLTSRLLSSRGGYALNTASGYYVSHDDSTLLIFVKPTHPSDDVPFAQRLLEEIEAIEVAAVEEYAAELDTTPAEAIGSLKFGATGMHAISAIESRVLRKDGVRAVGWSLVLVLLLFAIVFRRLDSIIFVGVPLVAALTWTLGFTYLVIGHLNLLSTGFAAIVLGLGVDHAIHIYNRYLDHRNDGESANEALEAAIGDTGTGVIIGAVTSAGAFFALLFYDFRGLREFGFVVGSGVLFSLLSMLTLLPTMLSLKEKFSGKFHQRVLMPFGTRALAASVASRPWPYLIASIIVTVVLGGAATQVGWQGRILGDDFSSNPALALREELRAQFQSSPDTLRLLIRGTSLDALDEEGLRAYRALTPLVESGVVGNVDAIHRYLQPPEVQAQTLSLLGSDPRFDGARIEAELRDALREAGFREAPFEPAIATVKRAFGQTEAVGLANLVAAAGESAFLGNYFTNGGDHNTLALSLSSGLKGFKRDDIDAIEARLRETLPSFDLLDGEADVVSFLAGGKIVGRELRGTMKEGYALVTAIALLLVLGVLTASFRKPLRILLALTPLVLGVTWMLGIMTLTGIDMNVINVPVTAMILGIGIDDAVHVVHAFFHSAKWDVRQTYRTTGKALVLTTLTTTAGFGSLAFAGHPGLRSMGLLAILGCVTCLVATLTTLPAIMALVARRHGISQPGEAPCQEGVQPTHQD